MNLLFFLKKTVNIATITEPILSVTVPTQTLCLNETDESNDNENGTVTTSEIVPAGDTG